MAVSDALGAARRHLERGALVPAREMLLVELDRRDDPACALAARLLRAQADNALAPRPDALATALDRLLALVETQAAQLRAMQELVERTL